MQTPTLRVWLFVTTIFFYSGWSHDIAAGEATVSVSPYYWTWREFVDGQRVVKETGPQIGVGFAYRFDDRSVSFTPRVELFGGSVDYDGLACDDFNNCQPATADVNYFGIKIEGDLSGTFSTSRRNVLEPFAGIGLRAWSRDLVNAVAADGSAVGGYTEEWLSFYGRAGVRFVVGFGMEKQVFAEGGVKLPFYSQNKAYVSDIGLGNDLTLEPGEKASGFAEAGFRIRRFSVSAFYDSFEFPQSESKSNGVIVAYQPESTMDIYGFKLGWTF
jgi:hypothetical protein